MVSYCNRYPQSFLLMLASGVPRMDLLRQDAGAADGFSAVTHIVKTGGGRGMSMRQAYGKLLIVPLVLISLLFVATPAFCAATDADTSQLAQAKFDAGDLDGATALCMQLLQLFPHSGRAPGAQLMLARIKLKMHPDATQDLLDAFALVRTRYPSSPESADALVHTGFLHSRSDAAQAVRDFREFATAYPTHPSTARVQQSLGRLYLRTLDLDKAEAAFDAAKIIAGAPASLTEEAALQSGFVKIMKYYASKNKTSLQAAIDALSRVRLSSQPKIRARADLGIAEATFLSGKYGDAHDKYAVAAQEHASQPYFRGIALYGTALSSQETGKMEQAVGEYSAFLNGLSGSTLAAKDRSWRAIALASTSASAQASVLRDGDWKRLPGSDLVLQSECGLSKCLFLLRRYDDALRVLAEVVGYLPEGNDDRAQALILLERCQDAKGGG